MIRCFPKKYLEDNIKEYVKDTVLISITSTVETPLSDTIKNYFVDTLSLVCDDLNIYPDMYNAPLELEGMKLLNKHDIDNIECFYKKHKDKNIYIHCSAGVSRSGAVAVGLTMIDDDFDKYRDVLLNNDIYPNELILIEFIKRYNPIKTKSIHNLYTILEKKKKPDINFCMKTFTYKILDIEEHLQQSFELLKDKTSKDCLERIERNLQLVKEYKNNK